MNLFYESYPNTIEVDGEIIPILTDFRDYVRLLDMLRDSELDPGDKYYLLSQYFLLPPSDFRRALDALMDFITLTELWPKRDEGMPEEGRQREVYSFQTDYPFIFSAFLRDYRINLQTIPYMHWWEFKMLFDGLSEDTEIKKRIFYRSLDAGRIKDREERKRVEAIQRAIKLPDADLVTDYDIGDALW